MIKYFIEEMTWCVEFYNDHFHTGEMDDRYFNPEPYDTVEEATKKIEELVKENQFKETDEYVMEYVVVQCDINPGQEITSEYVTKNWDDLECATFYLAAADDVFFDKDYKEEYDELGKKVW